MRVHTQSCASLLVLALSYIVFPPLSQLDPYVRSEEKRGGAWMDVCLGRSDVLQRKPVAYLVCNGSPPVKKAATSTTTTTSTEEGGEVGGEAGGEEGGMTPSLMTFSDVTTLFHEFGHGLQHMLTEVTRADAAGIENVEWDAVELPSQFMENWYV